MQEADNRKVFEVYDIDVDEMHIRGGEYWESAYKFWETNKDALYTSMSSKQKAWLLKIEKSLNEENSR